MDMYAPVLKCLLVHLSCEITSITKMIVVTEACVPYEIDFNVLQISPLFSV